VTPDDRRRGGGEDEGEGWESLAEEASGGSLAPSPELEEALREAAEAVEAREKARGTAGGKGRASPGAAAEEAAAERDALRAELEALRERHVRLQADFENHRRRSLREREDAYQYGHENVVKDLLGSVDNLDRAIEHASQSGGGDFQGILQGVELVRRDLLAALAKHGVSEIEAEGVPFDPSAHEAVAQQEDDTVPANTVVQVFQKGYRLRDRLLRPTRVVVSRRSDAGQGEEGRAASGDDEPGGAGGPGQGAGGP
jgi:molecular chaperone GrpE